MPIDGSAHRTAFVLAGGGSFGAIQVGMLRALVQHGVKADLIVGSSAGAINGAYFAGSPDADGVAKLETIWRGLRRSDIFPVSFRALAGFLWRRDFLVDASGLRRLIATHLPYANIEDAKVPLHVVATDVLSGEAVVLSKGPASDAIAASAAIPAAFPAVHHSGCYLVDGAVTSNTPIKVAVSLGATRVIVLPTGFACALPRPPQGALASGLHALTLLIARQLVGEVEGLGTEVSFHIAPPLCPLDGSPYDFSRTGELIERAAASTAQWLESGGLDRREIPGGLRAHKHVH